MNKKRFLILFFALVFIVGMVSAAHAQYDYKPLENIPGSERVTDFPGFILGLYKFVIWAVGIAALLMITIGGFLYLTSEASGNTSKMDTAKKLIKDALLGLFIALAAYLILFIINPDLVNIEINLKPISLRVGETVTPSGKPIPAGSLAKGCNNYASAFSSASDGDKNSECLLIAIANQESGCNPNLTSSHQACGLMQILPSTANTSCNDLISDPARSIQIAKQYLDKASGNIQNHIGFDIGSGFGLSGNTIKYGSFSYDTGNDDLIASYNAGSGKVAATAGKKGPFEVSSDCPSPTTPAWQCDKNPGGFSETQGYVTRVQQFQRQCLSK